MESGIEIIARERKEQIVKHGRTVERDVIENSKGQIIWGARALLVQECIDPSFPPEWDEEICAKMASKSYVERLAIVGAFCAAEIDRELYLLNELKES